MSESVATIILILAAAYAGIGIAIGGWFVFAGIARIDQATAHVSLGFRLIIWPGAAALWPWVLVKFANARPRGGEHP
ncbi:MAG: hypothetical protein KF691_15590 [Phycisphaeraceae bacterium]|nr:hypothetical protein [Phycisphaeraceae bacterium]